MCSNRVRRHFANSDFQDVHPKNLLALRHLLSYFFVKKIPLSRRVAYVLHGSMGESVSQ